MTSSSTKATISTASTTLYDLCDSSYSTKHCVKGKKRKASLADDKSLAVTRIKALAINSSSNSTMKNQRVKDQCGMGPRVEIVNGKIIVRESSLVSSLRL